MNAAEIVSYHEPQALAGWAVRLPALFVPEAKAAERFIEFFTVNIRNRHTRRSYYKAACDFSDWCGGRGLSLPQVKPFHVAGYIEELQRKLARPSVKLRLAGLRMLFDWLVIGHVMESNPAHAVRGPRFSVKTGKTPVLDRDDARALLAVIDVSTVTGLRDRALIATMLYTFARIGAVLQMNVRDYFTQGRRGHVRLQEKGGKEQVAACHHKLESYLDEYIAAAGIAADLDGPLFLTTGRKTGKAHRMAQQDGYRMIERYARAAGIETKIGNHSLRGTGLTDYLSHPDAKLEIAREMANHADTRTTQLYDRRKDLAGVSEYEKVGI